MFFNATPEAVDAQIERLRARADKARTAAAEADRELGVALLDAEDGGDQRAAASAQQKRDAAHKRVVDLELAIQAAHDRRQTVVQEQDAKQVAQGWLAAEKLMIEREKSADRVDKLLTDLAKELDKLHQASVALVEACPAKFSRHTHQAGWSRTEGAVRHVLRQYGALWATELHPTMTIASVGSYVRSAHGDLRRGKQEAAA